jgi:glucosamine--fructose-6-phosphate aminotransferase (isomerizing)
MNEAARQGRPSLTITNVIDSPLARASQWVLDIGAGVEAAVAATKSYTAELLALAMVSEAWGGSRSVGEELRALPDAVDAVLRRTGEVEDAAAIVAGSERLVVLGRGFHHATAFEWALKVQELAYVLAQPYAEPDFRHGPQAVVERGLPVLVVATGGPVYPGLAELATDMMDRGAPVVAISDQSTFPATCRLTIPVVPEWLSPIVAVVYAQLFAFYLARSKGVDPDHPRHLTKVTRTA